MEDSYHPVSQRIKFIVDKESDGSIRKFALRLGYDSSQKLNRLFLIDKRTNKYPKPSGQIVTDISNKLNISTDWLLNGTGDIYKSETNTTTDMKNKDLEIEMLRQRIKDLEEKLDMCRELREQDRKLLDKSL